MPYNPIADNTALTAAHLLAEVYNQVISQVTSSSRPGSPVEGQKIYETDTDREYTWNGSLWVQTGSVGAGFTWTPVVTQGSAIAKTITAATYHKHGRLITLFANLALTASGSGSNVVITVTGLPFNQAQVGMYGGGSGIIYDSGGPTIYPYQCVASSATELKFADSTAAVTVNVFAGQSGSVFGGQLTSGDVLSFTHTYESTA
jgi:hypothetical protein